MLKKIILSFVLFACLASALPIHEAKNMLKEGKQDFDRANYKEAIVKLNRFNILQDLDSYNDIKQAYEILIVSYFHTNQKEKAKEIVKDMLSADDEFTISVFNTPPEVLNLIENERKNLQEKSKNLAESKAIIKIGDADLKNILQKDSLSRPKNKFVSSIIPFGINHYLEGSTVKTLVYCSLQTLALSANIASFWFKQSYLTSYGSSNLKDNSYKKNFNLAQNTQFISLASFILSYGVSVADALISY